ncbi:hypothetical protein M2451_002330 [Dysgonomonas sp. PFB1-18]|uniref:hypothetical protein n=1 Tax=unclassified Dysgonomonas TaxID=2630389 RepID=UPI00247478AD|nr:MULTISPECIES: hypothetical protein [unclassified Dysgonomonas]MDH6307096.1 hypothetical protein [Dysgonomonas sp. PF1-14]MDH6337015.1 hypothetical protein [Dysgonomonas sp. PF1-16]MDH6381001.1 hypothetical protein [Dysgonomonas sp. PFB1-18]MDH6396420.1 hypothetical protein [Dysgonomonas sp. PF1-23]
MDEEKKEDNTILIHWKTPIDVCDKTYKTFRRHPDWHDGMYDYVKDMEIEKVEVIIPNYSKYYEKYKPKETKSAQDDIVTKNPDGSLSVKREW